MTESAAVSGLTEPIDASARLVEEALASVRASLHVSGRLLETLSQHDDAIRRYLHAMRLDNAGEDFVVPYVNDALTRFSRTLALLPPLPGLRTLEIGANPYLLSMLVRRVFDFESTYTNFFGEDPFQRTVSRGEQSVHNEITGESFTFGYDAFNIELVDFPYPDESFDVVLFCEVLEHLALDPLSVFARIRRVLRPGGKMILTTPNAVRLANVASILAGSNFFDRYHPQFGFYARHSREFTVEELQLLAEKNGFEVESNETHDRYDYSRAEMWKDNYEERARVPWTPRALRLRMRAIGADMRHRGDNIYLVARRPR